MNAIPYKAKQFLLVLLKLLIVCGAVAFLYAQLKTKDLSDWHLVTQKFTFLSFLGILFLSFLNWLLECLKWKNLVSGFKKITFKKAVEQTLGSLTASIFTPNRIGEYVAKGMYYSKEQTKKIIFLNFLGNSVQMLVTLFFGLIGCVFFFVLSPNLFEENYFTSGFLFWLPVILAFGLILGLIYFKKWRFYGYSIDNLIGKIHLFPARKHFANVQFSILRYLVFSHQFYFLLLLFDVNLHYPDALLTIFTMYFFASVVPTIHLMDVVVKGSVAVFLFGKLGVNQWTVVSVTTVMWLLNLVIPVLIGSVFVLNYKPLRK